MVHPAPRPTAKKLEAKTNDEIESNTAFMDAADGSALEKSEIYKTYAPRFALLSPSAFLSFSALNLTPHPPLPLPSPCCAAQVQLWRQMGLFPPDRIGRIWQGGGLR